MKLTLIGRPKQVAKAETCVVAVMEGGNPPTNLPKGLPPTPKAKHSYAIFISNKQWNRVSPTLQHYKEDELIIEGYPVFDPKRKATIVLAQSVLSKEMQRGNAIKPEPTPAVQGQTEEAKAEAEAIS